MPVCRRGALCLLVVVLLFGAPITAPATATATADAQPTAVGPVLQTGGPADGDSRLNESTEDNTSTGAGTDTGNETATNTTGSASESEIDGEAVDGDAVDVPETGIGNAPAGDVNTGSPGSGAGNESASPGGSSGGGGLGGGLFSVEDRMDDIKSWFMETAAEGSAAAWETLMEELNQLLYTLPAPGEADDPWSWYTPDNGWWPDVMGLYWTFGSVSVGVLILAGGASFIVDDPDMSQGFFRLSVLGLFAIVAGPLFIGAYLHFMNHLSLALAPSGQEFLEGPDNMIQLAAGSGLFFVLLKIKVGLLIIGMIVLFGQFIFTFVTAAMWPFSWPARAVPVGSINSLGVLIFNTFVYLPLLKVVQAAIMRFMFELSWGAYNWIGGLLVMIGTIIVVAVVFILLPWKSAEKLLHAAGVHLGMSAIREKSQDAKDVTIEGASNLKQKWVDSPRGQTSTNASSEPNRTARSRRSSTSTSSASAGSGGGPSISSGSADRQQTIRRRRRSIQRNRATRSDD